MTDEAPVMDTAEAQETEQQAVVEPTTETLLPESGEVQTGWKFADGIDGTGDKPEWFLGDKYGSVADQAKAYKELSSRFGSFTGAPKDGYEVKLDEGFDAKGFELDPESPFLETAMEYAKEMNMSQDGFGKILELYAMEKVAENEAMESYQQEYLAEQKKELGKNADTLLKDIADFGRANIPNELYGAFQEMATSADSIRVIEHLMRKAGNAPVSPQGSPASGVTKQELHEMQFKTNDQGQRLIQIDKEYRAEWEQKMRQYHGDGAHRVEVG